MIHSKFIGEKISSGRKKISFSQAELAEKLFISPQAIGKWERGESLPDITTLNRLAEIFSVDLNCFSENFSTQEAPEPIERLETSNRSANKQSWDLSKQNLVDLDLSGIENLNEQLNASNIQNCLFVGSNLQGISLKSNNISNCDFSNSNLGNSQIQNSNLSDNSFENSKLTNSELLKSYFTNCNFNEADFSETTFNSSYLTKCKLQNATFKESKFLDSGFQDLVFNGTIENSSFENCSFSGVTFENATLINTFFKNNRKLKTVQFIDCQMDKLTYAFLKNNQANLKDVVIIDLNRS
jgi:uncharacterized protein YjbI with pentapeptide repeats